jgi:hypothetical protein
MKSLLCGAAVALCSVAGFCAATLAEDAVYEGPWRTTNRKLDGTMTCAVKDLGENKWTGRFYGVWQGVPFDYTVAFSGPPDKLQGKATIDGADYIWSGSFNSDDGRFKGNFGGNRYSGYFDLAKKEAGVAADPKTVRR